MRSSQCSAPLFLTRGCLYIDLLVLSVRSLANDSYTQRNKTDLLLRAIENDLFANESRKHGSEVSRHLSESAEPVRDREGPHAAIAAARIP